LTGGQVRPKPLVPDVRTAADRSAAKGGGGQSFTGEQPGWPYTDRKDL